MCIYIIGMGSNASDYVQEWHQHGCYETYPIYARESNGSNQEYLCHNYNWYASDVNCSEFDPFDDYPIGKHELGECLEEADIFACSGQTRARSDALTFYDDGDRYATK